MNAMRRLGFATAGCLWLALAASGAQPDGAWGNLSSVTWRRSYTVLLRDGKRTYGRIVSVSADSVTLRPPDSKAQTVIQKRSDVLRISDGNQPSDLIYSGRSSWADIQAIPPLHAEHLLAVTKSGQRFAGKAGAISDAAITLDGRTIPKADVSQIYYVRVKPASDSAEYAAQEAFALDPEIWPYLLGIPKMLVLLYDSSALEENTPIRREPPVRPVEAPQWRNLEQVTWSRKYTFVLRDGTSTSACIVGISADSVKLGAAPAQLARPDVVRVSDGPNAENIIYGARGSWSDVQAILSRRAVALRVVTKTGASLSGKTRVTADGAITLYRTRLTKADVARVYYWRKKPASGSGQCAAQSWPLFGRGISVLLYDSSAP